MCDYLTLVCGSSTSVIMWSSAAYLRINHFSKSLHHILRQKDAIVTFKVAVVGTGNVAQKNYLPFLARQQDITLSYYNRTRAKAELCADTFGGWVADSIDSLMSASPDIVFVLTNKTARY